MKKLIPIGNAVFAEGGGKPGEAAGFGDPSISVQMGESNSQPSASITTSGPDTAKVFDFKFTIPKGDKGDPGEAGPQGEAGPIGETGPAGPQGEIGPQGPKGADGTMSFTDLTEEQKQSLKGDKGDTGPQGPQGLPGEKGETGAKGERGNPGPAGPQGETGPIGPRGEKGPKGNPGDKGDVGPEGPQGKEGLIGPQGPKGRDGKVVAKEFLVTALLNNWTGDIAPYTQEIPIPDVTAIEVPFMDLEHPIKEDGIEFNKISTIVTIENGIKLQCLEEKPNKDLKLKVYIIPSNLEGGSGGGLSEDEVRAVSLTGLNKTQIVEITETDNILSGFGKLQSQIGNISKIQNGNNLVEAINAAFQYADNGKKLIIDAIIGKGGKVNENSTFQELADAIKLLSGTVVSLRKLNEIPIIKDMYPEKAGLTEDLVRMSINHTPFVGLCGLDEVYKAEVPYIPVREDITENLTLLHFKHNSEVSLRMMTDEINIE